jgi:hypothetical protein
MGKDGVLPVGSTRLPHDDDDDYAPHLDGDQARFHDLEGRDMVEMKPLQRSLGVTGRCSRTGGRMVCYAIPLPGPRQTTAFTVSPYSLLYTHNMLRLRGRKWDRHW